MEVEDTRPEESLVPIGVTDLARAMVGHKGAELVRRRSTRIALSHQIHLPKHKKVFRSVSILRAGNCIAAEHDHSRYLWMKAAGEYTDQNEDEYPLESAVTAENAPTTLGFRFSSIYVFESSLSEPTRQWEAPLDEVYFSEEPSHFVENCSISTDGKVGATVVSGARNVRVWDLTSGKQIAELDHEQLIVSDKLDVGDVSHLSVIGDGTHLVSAFEESVYVWQIADEAVVAQVHLGRTIKSLWGGGDGDEVHVGTYDGLWKKWKWRTDGVTDLELDWPGGSWHQVIVGKGDALAAAELDGDEAFVFASDGTELFRVETGDHKIEGLAASPDSTMLAIFLDNGELRLFDVNEDGEEQTFWVDMQPSGFAFTLKGDQLVTSGEDTEIHLVDVNTGGLVRTVETGIVGGGIPKLFVARNDLLVYSGLTGEVLMRCSELKELEIPPMAVREWFSTEGLSVDGSRCVRRDFRENNGHRLRFEETASSESVMTLDALPNEEILRGFISADGRRGGVVAERGERSRFVRIELDALEGDVGTYKTLEIDTFEHWFEPSPTLQYFAGWKVGTNDEAFAVVWSTETREEIWRSSRAFSQEERRSSTTTSLVWLPDESGFVFQHQGLVELWDLRSGEISDSFDSGESGFSEMKMRSDGRAFGCLTEDSRLLMFKLV